ncbi:MAG: hypothetical protein VX899_12785 [Myxococcota bacterium]|nr:hypothetical protein [Myxococcota bacterium]
MSSTKSPLTHLEALLQDDASQDVLLQGEVLLEELHPLQDIHTAAKLIQLFTDKDEHQDLLFSVLQVLEAAPPRVLATALLAEAPQLSQRSRHWPEVFFLRACRSLTHRAALSAAADQLPRAAREETKAVLGAIIRKNPGESVHLTPLWTALSGN